MAYREGDFSFVGSEDMRRRLESMYAAVEVTENWDNLKKAEPGDGGFMFTSDPELRRIMQEIRAADNYKGHSGFSYAWTLGMMEFIAKNGWAAFYAASYIEELKSKIAKLREVYDNALLDYRLILEQAKQQTTPEEKLHFKGIVEKETLKYDKALYALAGAEKELEMFI